MPGPSGAALVLGPVGFQPFLAPEKSAPGLRVSALGRELLLRQGLCLCCLTLPRHRPGTRQAKRGRQEAAWRQAATDNHSQHEQNPPARN